MRTKTLLLSAAAIAAGLLSASAQVYSVNVVGYVNSTYHEGFQVVANPLDKDGTNLLSSVIGSQLPVNSEIYIWNGTTYNGSTFTKNKAGTATNWSPDVAIPPGLGFWVGIPTGSGNVTNTFVGNVMQGNLTNSNVVGGSGGFSIVGSQVPQAGGLTTTLKYNPQANDAVYTWANPGWTSYNYTKNKAGTSTNWDTEPTIAVGQGFWLATQPGASWVRNFTVQ